MSAGQTSRQVATNVADRRKARQWTQARLSEEVGKVGHKLPEISVQRLERGERRIDVDDLTALAATFGVPPSFLLYLPGACSLCGDAPPAGFACNACGAEGAAGECSRCDGAPPAGFACNACGTTA